MEKVVLLGGRQLRNQEIQKDRTLLPVGVGVGKDAGKKVVSADESLGFTLEIYLTIFLEFALVDRYAGVENRIQLVAFGPAQVALHEVIDLLLGIHLDGIQIRLQVVQFVGICLVGQDSRPIEVRERVVDGVDVVQEIQHEDIVLLGVCPVEPRQGLHRLDAGERLVHIHGVQQRFVIPGLELVGTDQEAVWILLEPRGDPAGGKAVQ